MEYVKGDTITFDNNVIYMIMEVLDFNSNNYLFLANVDDETDIIVRRIDLSDGSCEGLDSDDEYNQVILEFGRKMQMI